jgi:hypothetical protein
VPDREWWEVGSSLRAVAAQVESLPDDGPEAERAWRIIGPAVAVVEQAARRLPDGAAGGPSAASETPRVAQNPPPARPSPPGPRAAVTDDDKAAWAAEHPSDGPPSFINPSFAAWMVTRQGPPADPLPDMPRPAAPAPRGPTAGETSAAVQAMAALGVDQLTAAAALAELGPATCASVAKWVKGQGARSPSGLFMSVARKRGFRGV